MNGVLGNLINGFAEIWKNIGVAQKVSIVLIALLAIGATALIIYTGSQPNWRILYSNLDRETASKVYDIIQDENIPVKLVDSGRTIMVPDDKVYSLRLKVASEGVPVGKTGTGWELFENMKLGLTDKQQRVAFQRAVQGELERMITEMPGVISCKVMLTMPQKKVFRKEKTKPSASIMLVMERGRRLPVQQIESIRYMVSSAVENLNPQDVTITDNNGNLLARKMEEDGTGFTASNRHLEIKDLMEQQLKNKAETILSPIVGPENVVATVSCEVDFDRIDRIIERYDAENTAIVKEKVVNEDSAKQGQTNGGPAGTASNLVDVANPDQAQQKSGNLTTEQRKTSERQFVVPKTVEKVTINGGRILKATVAVTIGKKPDGSDWSQDDISKFVQLVTNAVGATTYPKYDKNDIQVKEMQFITPAPPETMTAPMMDQMVFNLEKFSDSPLIRPVVGLLLLLTLYKIFRKYFSKGDIEGAEMPSGLYGENLSPLGAGGMGELGAGENDHLVEAAMNAANDRTKNVNPEMVAQVMENWLKSETNI